MAGIRVRGAAVLTLAAVRAPAVQSPVQRHGQLVGKRPRGRRHCLNQTLLARLGELAFKFGACVCLFERLRIAIASTRLQLSSSPTHAHTRTYTHTCTSRVRVRPNILHALPTHVLLPTKREGEPRRRCTHTHTRKHKGGVAKRWPATRSGHYVREGQGSIQTEAATH